MLVNREFHFTVDGLEFSGKFPLPSEERNIYVIISKRLNGVPVDSIPENVYLMEEICSTLNFVLRDRPKEFQETDFMDYYDPEFTFKLWNEYTKKLKEFRESLKKNNDPRRNTETNSNSRNNPEPISNEKLRDSTRRIK